MQPALCKQKQAGHANTCGPRAGYTIQDARMFTLSTTLPVTRFSSYSTPASFSLRSALFSLATADNRDVIWECQLTLANGVWDSGLIPGLGVVPTAGTSGPTTWQSCDTPKVRPCATPALVHQPVEILKVCCVLQQHTTPNMMQCANPQ